MNLKRTALGAALAVVLLGGGAAAVGAAGEGCWRGPGGGFGPAGFHAGGWGPGPMGPCSERRAERMEDMLAAFESFAKLTGPQQEAWDGLKAKVRAGNERFEAACAAMTGDPGSLSPDQRLERVERMLEAGLTTVRDVRPAFDAFYATLDDQQKQAVDRLLRHHRG